LTGVSKIGPATLLLLTLVLASGSQSAAADLKLETLAAWARYLQSVDAHVAGQTVDGRSIFLSADAQAERNQPLLRRGEVVMTQIKPPQAAEVPSGLIHHWIGTVFIPGVTLADVLAVERDYDRYPQWFGPTITHAILLERTRDRDDVAIRYIQSALFVTVVLEAEYDIRYFQVDPTKLYSIGRSIRVQEIHNYGKPEERKLPVDDASGYLWRIHGIARYEQRDNGVYLEQETIGLSRRIPASLRWLVEPAVRRMSRELLRKSLEQTRNAVLRRSSE